MESGPGAFPGSSCRRARTNLSEVKSLEMHNAHVVRSWNCLMVRYLFIHKLSDLRSLVLHVPFFTSYDAMELAVMGYGQCRFLLSTQSTS